MAWILILIVALVSAFGWHLGFPGHFVTACLGAAVSGAVMFIAVDAVHLGYVDPFFAIAGTTVGGFSLLVATAVGLGLRALTRRQQ